MDGESRTSGGSSLAWCSLDAPLHTQQQIVPEELGQREAVGSLAAAVTQLSAHGQPGQVLQPPGLVHHGQGRAVEGFMLLGQEWNRVRWAATLNPGYLVVGLWDFATCILKDSDSGPERPCKGSWELGPHCKALSPPCLHPPSPQRCWPSAHGAREASDMSVLMQVREPGEGRGIRGVLSC